MGKEEKKIQDITKSVKDQAKDIINNSLFLDDNNRFNKSCYIGLKNKEVRKAVAKLLVESKDYDTLFDSSFEGYIGKEIRLHAADYLLSKPNIPVPKKLHYHVKAAKIFKEKSYETVKGQGKKELADYHDYYNTLLELADRMFYEKEYSDISKYPKILEKISDLIIRSQTKDKYYKIENCPELLEMIAAQLVKKREYYDRSDPYEDIENEKLLEVIAAKLVVAKNDPEVYKNIKNKKLLEIIDRARPEPYVVSSAPQPVSPAPDVVAPALEHGLHVPDPVSPAPDVVAPDSKTVASGLNLVSASTQDAQAIVLAEVINTKNESPKAKGPQNNKFSLQYNEDGSLTITPVDDRQLAALDSTGLGTVENGTYVIPKAEREDSKGVYKHKNGTIKINSGSPNNNCRLIDALGLQGSDIASSPKQNALIFSDNDNKSIQKMLQNSDQVVLEYKDPKARRGEMIRKAQSVPNKLSDGDKLILTKMLSDDPTILERIHTTIKVEMENLVEEFNNQQQEAEQLFALQYNSVDGSLSITPKDPEQLRVLIATGIGKESEDGQYVIDKSAISSEEKGGLVINCEDPQSKQELLSALGLSVKHTIMSAPGQESAIYFSKALSDQLKSELTQNIEHTDKEVERTEIIQQFIDDNKLPDIKDGTYDVILNAVVIGGVEPFNMAADAITKYKAALENANKKRTEEANNIISDLINQETIEETYDKIADKIAKNPKLLKVIVEEIINKNNPEIYDNIKKIPELLQAVAMEIVNQNDKETYDKIAKSPELLEAVAKEIVNQNDKETYDKIAKSPKFLKPFVTEIINENNPKIYYKIAKSPELLEAFAKEIINQNNPEIYDKIAKSPELLEAVAKEIINKNNPEIYDKIAENPKLRKVGVKEILNQNNPKIYEEIVKSPKLLHAVFKEIVKIDTDAQKDKLEKIPKTDEFDQVQQEELDKKVAYFDLSYNNSDRSLSITPGNPKKLAVLEATGLGKLSEDGKSYIISEAKSDNSKGVHKNKEGTIQINSDSPDGNHKLINALGLVGHDIASSPKQNALIFSDKHQQNFKNGEKITLQYTDPAKTKRHILFISLKSTISKSQKKTILRRAKKPQITDGNGINSLNEGEKVILTKMLADNDGLIKKLKKEIQKEMKPLVKDYKKRQKRAEEIERKAEEKFKSQKQKGILKLKTETDAKKAKDYLVRKAQDKENATPLERARMEAKDIVAKIGRIMFNDQSRYRDNSTKAGVVYNSKKDIQSR